jgi:hypothetical protein
MFAISVLEKLEIVAENIIYINTKVIYKHIFRVN